MATPLSNDILANAALAFELCDHALLRLQSVVADSSCLRGTRSRAYIASNRLKGTAGEMVQRSLILGAVEMVANRPTFDATLDDGVAKVCVDDSVLFALTARPGPYSAQQLDQHRGQIQHVARQLVNKGYFWKDGGVATVLLTALDLTR